MKLLFAIVSDEDSSNLTDNLNRKVSVQQSCVPAAVF